MRDLSQTVIDSMMGSGKTSWAIQEMNANKEKSYIFVTPFLSEIDRIKKETDITFYEPIQKGKGKLDSFHELLSNGENVAVTHKLFTMMTDDTRNLIRRGKYILIIDEVLEVTGIYIPPKKDTMSFLKKKEMVSIDENDYVTWLDKEDYGEYPCEDIEILSKNRCLLAYSNTIFLWQFPPDIFKYCEYVYIMTYGFEGTVLNAYFKLHGFLYEKKQITKIDNNYFLMDYINEIEHNEFKNLITICEDEKLNEIGEKTTALSKSWYITNFKERKVIEDDMSDEQKREIEKINNEKMEIAKKLKNNITNYLQNKMKCTSNDVMWTTFNEFENKLTGKGRTFNKKLNPDEKRKYRIHKQSGDRLPSDLQKIKCFVTCNARATNIYGDRSVLVYPINYYINPVIVNFLQRKNIDFDEDQYALNGLIQWIWRSRIRNGEPISIYIPSSRMRNLLKDWLGK